MSRAMVVINTANDRHRASSWIHKAPWGTRITFQATKRTLPQNDKMWACLTDIATQVVWYGSKYPPDDWKDIFTASLRKARVVPGIDPGSFVLLGMRTSDMTKDEMSALIELILAFGAEHGVTFNDFEPREDAA